MNIDPNILSDILNVVLGVVASGLTSLLAYSGQKVNEIIVGKEFLEKLQLETTSLQPILHKAIKDVAEDEHTGTKFIYTIEDEPIDRTEDKHTARDIPKGIEIISLFLLTPEVEDLVRQIYSTKILYDNKRNDVSSIRRVLSIQFSNFVAAYPSDLTPKADQIDNIANLLFDMLIKECDFLLSIAIDKGILAAHEAKDAFRHNILNSQIEAIQKELELLSKPNKVDRRAILDFEKQYRRQVGQRHSHITPPNLDTARPRPIDDLYVWPHFMTKDRQNELIEKDEFLSYIYRAVLLGNPGAGKSTLSLKLCHELTEDHSQRSFAGRKELTPILVILRNYGIEKKERRCSIIEFIEAEAKATYQLPVPPYQTFEYLLLTGQALVIFDGLDELLDTSYRQEIRNDIESFCHLYPSAPVLVTSREIGYEQAPLNEKMFQTFYLSQFDEDQVRDYTEKWFTIADAEYLTDEQRKIKIGTFLKESTIVPDLRSNPLMLALLCSIYREENYIPRYRPDVYEKCAIMLFERWDKTRSLYAPPLPEERVRPLLEYLAYWIYGDELLRGGVTDNDLITKATEYLNEWLYEDVYKARRVAAEFVSFCTGRVWVFTDTGTKREGEKLYQFVHATFLEYFTAAYLVSIHRTPKDLILVLAPKIAKREWDVVSQLAFQIQNKKNIGAADELLMALVTSSDPDDPNNKLSFTIRCLHFLVPRPKVRSYITQKVIEQFKSLKYDMTLVSGEVEWESLRDRKRNEELISLVNLLDLLLAVNVPDNRTTIATTLNTELVNMIGSDKDEEVSIALEIVIYIYWKTEDNVFWLSQSDQIFAYCSNKIETLYPKFSFLSIYALWRKKIHVSDLIRWHSLNGLLLYGYMQLFNMAIGSCIEGLMYYISDESIYNIYKSESESILEDLENELHAYPLPWFKWQEITSLDDGPQTFDGIQHRKLTTNNIFGVFLVLAIFFEFESLSLDEKKFNFYSKLKDDVVFDQKFSSNIDFYKIILARSEETLIDQVQTLLNRWHFTTEQQDFISKWVKKEFNLLRSSNEEKRDGKTIIE